MGPGRRCLPEEVIALAEGETNECYSRNRLEFLSGCERAYTRKLQPDGLLKRSTVLTLLDDLSISLLDESRAYVRNFAKQVHDLSGRHTQGSVSDLTEAWRSVVFLWYRVSIIHDIERVWIEWVTAVFRRSHAIGFVRGANSEHDQNMLR